MSHKRALTGQIDTPGTGLETVRTQPEANAGGCISPGGPAPQNAMNRTTLTSLYLDEIQRRGVKASELTSGDKLDAEMLQPFYQHRYLSRPLFLGQQEYDQLGTDLINLRSALTSLPDRLYGGDLPAFARAVGLTDVQISAVMRSRNPVPTALSRADLYVDDTGFRTLEFNMGRAIGGIDCADMIEGMLQHPVLAEFAERHQLRYTHTQRQQVTTIKAESGFPPHSRPMM